MEKSKANGLTKEQIEARVRAGKMSLDEAMKLLHTSIRFEVAQKSKWLSIYFPERKFPVSMPVEDVEAMLNPTTLDRLREFIDEHRAEFAVRKKG